MSAALVRVLDTLAGRLVVEATAHGVARIDRLEADVVAVSGEFIDDDDNTGPPSTGPAADHLARLTEHLDGYLAGTRRSIGMPWTRAAGIHDEFSREVYGEIHIRTAGPVPTARSASTPDDLTSRRPPVQLVPAQFLILIHR